MRNVVAFLILWLALVVESTAFQIQPINVIQPNLVLIVLVVVGLTRGPTVALTVGILVGFIQDTVYGSFLGLNAFTYGVIGYFAASLFAQFLHRNVSITFLVVLLFTFIENWITFALTSLFGGTAYSWHAVLSQLLWQMMVNGIVLLLLYPLLVRFFTDKPHRRYRDGKQESL